MGFLRRWLGGQASRGMVLNVNYFKRIRDEAVLQVVGEAYRQANVAMARPPSPTDLPPGLPPPLAGYYKATLIPQPSNPYDSNAIGVFLWAAGNWVLSGYLARTEAAAFQPLFRHLATQSDAQAAIACDAAIVPESGGRGVVLHMGTPGECAAELATDDVVVTDHPWVGKAVAVTGRDGTTLYGVPLDRAAQVMLVQWAGCDIMPRLTKRTGALIVANPEDLTGNLQRAKAYGIEVIEETAFLARIGLPAAAIGRVSARWARC